ncbi:hypothetical protein NTGM5_10174 [Candidatus Nitrotoga sp. M5]|nr:hypothetical protein NTGM5_10174 [Candidatus Nitrotoga sp. M5]
MIVLIFSLWAIVSNNRILNLLSRRHYTVGLLYLTGGRIELEREGSACDIGAIAINYRLRDFSCRSAGRKPKCEERHLARFYTIDYYIEGKGWRN